MGHGGAMIFWLLERVFRRGFASRRRSAGVGSLEDLARSGAAAWLLAQEHARLEFLAAKETYERTGRRRDFGGEARVRAELSEAVDLLVSLRWDGPVARLLHGLAVECWGCGVASVEVHVTREQRAAVVPFTGDYDLFNSYRHPLCPPL